MSALTHTHRTLCGLFSLLTALTFTAPLHAKDQPILAFTGVMDQVHALNAEGQAIYNYRLETSGHARGASDGSLHLAGGEAVAKGQGVILKGRLQARGAVTVTLLLQQDAGDTTKLAPILTLGGVMGFERRGQELWWVAADREPIKLNSPGDAALTHLTVVGDASGWSLYHNGAPTGQHMDGAPVFQAWSATDPTLGGGGWRGRIHRFAVYDRALSSEEVAATADREAAQARQSRPVPRLVMKGKLTAKSHNADLDEIAPYQESLSVYEYQVEEVSAGMFLGNRIRVAHWTVLGGDYLPARKLKVGDTVELTLEPFQANRQLKNIHLSDTLEIDFDLDLFYDVVRP